MKDGDAIPDAVPIDWNAALAAVGDDPVLLREIVQVLADDLPRLRQNVRDAVAANDLEAARRAAHSLKGSVRFLGNTAGYDVAQKLEQHASSSATTDRAGSSNIRSIWDELSVALDRLARSLDEFLETPQSERRSMLHDAP